MTRHDPIPPLSDFGPYTEAQTRKTELQVELAEVERKITDASARTARRRERQEDDARAVYEGRDPEPPRLTPALEALFERRRILQRAIDFAEKAMAEAHAKANRKILLELRPRHQVLLERVAKALAELGEAVAEELSFRDSVTDAGYSLGSGVLATYNWRRFSAAEEGSRVSMLLDELKRDSAIKVRQPARERVEAERERARDVEEKRKAQAKADAKRRSRLAVAQ